MHGLVLATMPSSGRVVVRHDALFGKPAGASTFAVFPTKLVRNLKAGTTIDATVDADSTPWRLMDIHVGTATALVGDGPVATALPAFRTVEHLVVGQYAPTTMLQDQDGRAFSLRQLRGQTVVMAFVYTRCRDSRECPLITSRFHQLQERFRSQPVHLVEVTLDPAFDTPPRLRAYGRLFANDPRRWTLATGDPDRVLDFAAQFDVTAFPDRRVGLIHAERLVIIDAYGAIRELIDEGSWTPDEIVAAVRHDERLASNPIERLDLALSAAAVSICGNAVAGFSGFTDLLVVIAIVAVFGWLLYRVARAIARGAA